MSNLAVVYFNKGASQTRPFLSSLQRTPCFNSGVPLGMQSPMSLLHSGHREKKEDLKPLVCDTNSGVRRRVVYKRVVLADVPRNQKRERGYIQMFPGTKNRDEGTFGHSPYQKPERGYIRQNHPFTKPPVCFLSINCCSPSQAENRRKTKKVGSRSKIGEECRQFWAWILGGLKPWRNKAEEFAEK